VKDILNIINKYNVPKNYLEIEVTETVDTVEYSALTRFISDLHDNGLLVSIDDFGTGVSSLNLLKDIPVDIIKLDKSFLSETEFKKKLSIVISDLIKMAKDLGIHTIMEGVETKEQAEFLEHIFCDAAQGYYFDKPLSHSDFTNILKRGGYIK
jgi:EAL domain-containing protein (putative c-di-GMP-specific phosphodiesterase class I)